MEQLHNGFTLALCEGSFPLSTDSMVLADFVRLPKKASVLDLGSGCGTLGLLLCARDPGCTVTGVELDEKAHNTAMDNILRNGLDGRLSSICADVRQIPSLMDAGSFSVCVSNPPYFTAGPHSKAVPLARREDALPLDALIHCAGWALKYGGDFFLVHRPERLAQICAIADREALSPKRLRLVRHREGGPVSLILLQCRKGAKPGLTWEDIFLFDKENQPTPDYRSIYHL